MSFKSKHKTIILDLDHTLVHSFRTDIFFKGKDYDTTQFIILESTTSDYISFKRSYVDEFLRFCFNKYHKVVIWSAGKREYVHEILDKFFGDYVFDAVLTRDNCVDLQKDFDRLSIKSIFEGIGVDFCDVDNDVIFLDDKIERIKNYPEHLKILKAPRFETKWMKQIYVKGKRKRPIREQDEYLKKIKHEL